jgi:hypothetical protein
MDARELIKNIPSRFSGTALPCLPARMSGPTALCVDCGATTEEARIWGEYSLTIATRVSHDCRAY